MDTDIKKLKDTIYDNLWRARFKMELYGAKTVKGLLSGMALWPVFVAAQKGDYEAMMALGKLAGDIGKGRVSKQLLKWAGAEDEKATVNTIEAALAAEPNLLPEMEALLEKLDVYTEALQRQAEDREWLTTQWQAETVIQQQVHINHGEITGVKYETHYHGVEDPEKGQAAEERGLQNYLDGLRKSCFQLPLASMGLISRPDKKVGLDQVYISLDTVSVTNKERDVIVTSITAIEDRGTVDTEEDGSMQHALEAEVVAAQEVAKRNAHMVLLGDPGAGKSTFVKHYLAACCNKEVALDTLPVMIVLRVLAERLREVSLPQAAEARQEALAGLVLAEAEEALVRFHAMGFLDTFRKKVRQGHCRIAYDGFDEVPLVDRPLLRDAILAVQAVFEPQHSIVTCRIRSYNGEAILEGYPSFTLVPLTQEKMDTFCAAWYQALADGNAYTSEAATQRSNDLIQAISNPTIGALGSNPMLLTTLAIVHDQDNHLPDQRVVLYNRAIEILLTKWDSARGKLEGVLSDELVAFLRDDTRVRPVLEEMAFVAHSASQNRVKKRQVADIELTEALRILDGALGDLELARAFLRYVDERAGLLVGKGDAKNLPARYSFAHRTLQEYLAGCYLLKDREGDMVRRLKKLAEDGEYWSLAVQLSGEELYYNRKESNKLLDVASLLCPETSATASQARYGMWAGYFATIPGNATVEKNIGVLQGGGIKLLERTRHALISGLSSPLPAQERAEAGRILARLGDPRPEVTTLEAMQFCYVPAGLFLMGDDHERTDVPYGYWISKFPVSNAQYQAFVDAGGYDNDVYWTGEGLKQKEKHGWKMAGPSRDPFNAPNHPVVYVTGYETYAFAQWMQTSYANSGMVPEDWTIGLPRADEWEKAARGGDQVLEQPYILSFNQLQEPRKPRLQKNSKPGRTYTWEGDEPDTERMNYSESGIGSTSAVGCYPGGVSVYGVHDMIGQVREWEDNGSADPYVLRGGSFWGSAWYCRCACRSDDRPNLRYDLVGFRLVLRPLGL